MGEQQYHVVGSAYAGSANLGLLQTEMKDRWGPVRANDGHVFYAKKETYSNHISFLGSRNNEQESVLDVAGPSPSFEWAANLAAAVAREGQQDPARPLQTVPLTQVLAPKEMVLH